MVPPAAGIEETWQIQQQQIATAVEQGAARKAFDLRLPDLGPYSIAYTRAGRHMVMGGTRGHLAVMEWQRGHLTCEVQVRVGGRHTRIRGGMHAVGDAETVYQLIVEDTARIQQGERDYQVARVLGQGAEGGVKGNRQLRLASAGRRVGGGW